MAILLAIAAVITVKYTASATQCTDDTICDAQAGSNAVVGSSFAQSSIKASVMSQPLQEDAFGELEDNFDILATSQQKIQFGSQIQSLSFWISCTQDIFVFGFVIFLVPFIAGKLLQPRAPKKEVEFEAPDLAVEKHQRSTVNLGPLMKAARSGDESAWRSLLKAIPNPAYATDNFGCTPLHVAADVGCVEMAQILIEAGADVNAKDAMEETPLHFASRRGTTEMCKILLAKGADLDATNSEDLTPLVTAAKAANESVCQSLLDQGATCQGLSDSAVPPLLASLLMCKMILPMTVH
jgi:hypothetical protein